jgi:hypothetical protein
MASLLSNPISNMEQYVTELKAIMSAEQEKLGKKARDHVSRFINKSTGKPTKAALALNRRYLREGKTYNYLDNTKIFNAKTKRLIDRKFDRRFTTPRPKPVENLVGSTLLKGSLLNTTDSNYRKSVASRLRTQSKGGSIRIDLTKMSLADALNIVIANTTDKYYPVARAVGQPRWVTLSPFNVQRLVDFQALRGDRYSQEPGSDIAFIINLDSSPEMEVKFVEKDGEQKPNGAFFKYYSKIDYDLTRYQIYNSAPEGYVENCLIHALRELGITEERLVNVKQFVRCGVVPQSNIKKLCQEIGISIILYKTRAQKQKTGKIFIKEYKTKYGTSKDEYPIALYGEHYFIYEKTKINSYPMENYEECKDYKDWFNIRGIVNGNVRRENNRGKTSLWIIRHLISNGLVEKINVDDLMKCQYFNNNTDTITGDLEYDEMECLRENTPSQVDRSKFDIVYFDFETITKGKSDVYEVDDKGNKKYLFKTDNVDLLNEYKNKDGYEIDDYRHQPYLMCALTQQGDKYHSVGENCGDDFIKWLKYLYQGRPANDKGVVADIVLMAHNLRYDFTFIWEQIFCLNVIDKGTRLMGGGGRIYIKKGRYINVAFLDSLNMVATKLSNFGSYFNLPIKKEIMPYNTYTHDNVKKRYIHSDKLIPYLKNELSDDEINEYKTNMLEWNCYDAEYDTYDIIEYSRRYCEMDCLVLRDGYTTFRQQMLSIDKNLDPINYCSAPGLAQDYLIRQGCFEDCWAMCGKPRQFIQQCVVGGRTMCRDNKKWLCREGRPISDYDACGLYNSAMVRMDGFLKGMPKVITNLNLDWLLENTDGFFVQALVLNDPEIKRGFPLLSVKNDEGIRDFTNDMKGEIVYIDKVGIEDAMKFQGYKFKLLCGYYYDEGHNTKIKQVAKRLYDERQKYKKLKNPIEKAYKLIINSAYGKTMLKPIDSNSQIVRKVDFQRFLSHKYNFIKDWIEIGDKYIVNTIKPIQKHFNNVYVGVEILSMSKRIMNEVMCLAEDNELDIFYQDTDSLHIYQDQVKPLEDAFREKYKREINGKGLGQFHVDFELKGANDIYATESIFLGKKCYLDVLVGKDEKGEEVNGYHIRMKGIPEDAIQHYCETYKTTIIDLYQDLYDNDILPDERKFDLLLGNSKVKFKMRSDYSISNVSEFSRAVCFNNQKGILVN